MLNENYMRVLYVNLSDLTYDIVKRSDLTPFLGGVGLATKLFDEMLKPDLDPFHPEQPVVLAIGPMSTIFPSTTKVMAMFKSPLTGELGESHAAGRLAFAMRFAGYDAIVFTGQAKEPVYLVINHQGVRFKNAEPLWDFDVEEMGRVMRELEQGNGHRSCFRIGPAGSNKVHFANVNVDTYRHFGRLGLGAVFGSKHLKAVVVHGTEDYQIPNFRDYNKIYNQIYKRINETEVMEKYHGLGTSGNVVPLSKENALPTRNLQQSQFEAVESISGEAFAKETLIRKQACTGCPVGCIHIGLLRQEFAPGHEYTSQGISYDHELIYSLGSNIGIENKEEILSLIEAVELTGLDAISTGVALGWVTEAMEKGLVSENEVGCTVKFGDAKGYLKVIDGIVKQPNEFYQTLAKGTWVAAERYQGEDFALVLGKNEVAGYHTGYGNLLGQAVGARHSHLDNAGYAADQLIKDFDADQMVEMIYKEEVERCILNALAICLFARKVYDRQTVLQALNSIGHNYSDEELTELGQKIYDLKLQIKGKLGFDFRKLKFPKRFFETESMHGKLQPEVMAILLDKYLAKLGITT